MRPEHGSPHIVGLGGSGRPGSSTDLALSLALAAAEEEGATVSHFDGAFLCRLPLYSHQSDRSDEQRRLVAAIRAAHGLIVATPGYHGGMSAAVKNAFDLLEDLRAERPPYLEGRAVGCIVTAAGWQSCGTTLVSLRSTVHALRGWPTPLGATLNSSEPLFDDVGRCVSPSTANTLRTIALQVLEFVRPATRIAARA